MTALGLAIALAGPPLMAAWSARVLRQNSSLATQILLQAIYCTLPLCLLLLVRYGERLPWTSVGLRRPTRATIVSAVVLVVTGFVITPILTEPLAKRWAQADVNAGITQLAIMPMWFRVIVSVTGGAIEELLYRGYAIERLAALTRRRWAGGRWRCWPSRQRTSRRGVLPFPSSVTCRPGSS